MDKIILIFLFIFFIILLNFKINENFKNKKNHIEIVISRYNEELAWIKDNPFNKYSLIVYNKGNNQEFTKTDKIKKVINLKNVGRCDHTYLYHIINNYENLADITIFLTGSLSLKWKYDKSIKLLEDVEKTNNTVIKGGTYEDVKKTFYNFTLDKWKVSDPKNYLVNSEDILEKSKIRPFGKWYEHHFGHRVVKDISFGGVLAVHKKHIIQHPKSYYENLIKDLENTSNPEVGHYVERSWGAIFYPIF